MFGGNSHASQVFHIWANQSKPDGRRADSRVFFRGPAFYSFGEHYVAGYIMPDGAALFNGTKYSPTTSGHVSAARGAAKHLTQYVVPELTALVTAIQSSGYAKFYDATGTYRAKTPAELKAGKAKAFRDHVTKHALEFSPADAWYGSPTPGSAAYLLTVAGSRNGAAEFAKIQAAAVKARDKKTAAEKVATRKQTIVEAKRAADMSPAEFRDYVTGLFDRTYTTQKSIWPRYDHATGTQPPHRYEIEVTGDLPRALKHFNGYLKLGKAVLGVKRAALLKVRRNALKAAMADCTARKAAIQRNESKRRALRTVRQGLAEIATGDASRFGTLALSQFHDSLRKVADVCRLPTETAVQLNELAGHVMTALLEKRAAEKVESERVAAERAERVAREVAEREARAAVEKAAWFDGDTAARWHGSDENGRAYLRAVNVDYEVELNGIKSGAIVGGTLQTSHGADVPLTHAVKAFRFIKLCRDNGRAFKANGKTLRVGHFQIDSIDTSGNFKAGCHDIAWQEVERVARALGVFEMTGDDSAVETREHA